jgi:hypothetical protein
MSFDLMSFCLGVITGDTVVFVGLIILSHLDK